MGAVAARTNELDFRLLGPVEVRRDGRLVTIRGRTTLAMLTRLLLSANEVVPTGTLINSVWGADLPAHPRAALHNGMSRLRRICGDSCIETLACGYALRCGQENVDLLRFTGLVRRARQAAGAGSLNEALADLDRAVALWREPLLGNVDSAALRSDAVPWLTERYLMVAEERAGLSLRLGREGSVVEQLLPLRAKHPFRERMASQLMVALARCGRRAEALAVFGSLRRALSEELGIDPSPALQELHLRILRADRGLDLRHGLPPLRGYGGPVTSGVAVRMST